MSRRSQDVALLTPEEQDFKDIEAGKSESDSQNQNLDHEYSIPSTVKFTWLGTYFFLSLVLTLYNKLVLGMVRSITFLCHFQGSDAVLSAQTLTMISCVLSNGLLIRLYESSFTSPGF